MQVSGCEEEIYRFVLCSCDQACIYAHVYWE